MLSASGSVGGSVKGSFKNWYKFGTEGRFEDSVSFGTSGSSVDRLSISVTDMEQVMVEISSLGENPTWFLGQVTSRKAKVKRWMFKGVKVVGFDEVLVAESNMIKISKLKRWFSLEKNYAMSEPGEALMCLLKN
ncbi:hypothetical protein Tco_1529744 [Tanacetum coccineum]